MVLMACTHLRPRAVLFECRVGAEEARHTLDGMSVILIVGQLMYLLLPLVTRCRVAAVLSHGRNGDCGLLQDVTEVVDVKWYIDRSTHCRPSSGMSRIVTLARRVEGRSTTLFRYVSLAVL